MKVLRSSLFALLQKQAGIPSGELVEGELMEGELMEVELMEVELMEGEFLKGNLLQSEFMYSLSDGAGKLLERFSEFWRESEADILGFVARANSN